MPITWKDAARHYRFQMHLAQRQEIVLKRHRWDDHQTIERLQRLLVSEASMATAEYDEHCCFNLPRDSCRGRGCPCVCHETVADHRLRAYCPPEHACQMTHPCHVDGCRLEPGQHPA